MRAIQKAQDLRQSPRIAQTLRRTGARGRPTPDPPWSCLAPVLASTGLLAPSMFGSRFLFSSVVGLAFALAVTGCSSDTTSEGETGSLRLGLEVDGITINTVSWVITAERMEPMEGTIDISAPGSTPSVEVFGLPPGDYTVTLSTIETDEQTECEGSEDFSIEVNEVTDIMVVLRCKLPQRLGGVRVNAEPNICAELTKMVVSPLQAAVGDPIDLRASAEDAEGDPIAYGWTATGGSIEDPTGEVTRYTCEEVGDHRVTVTVTDEEGYCEDGWTVDVTCVVATCPCFTVADVAAIATDPACDPICVVARPTALNLTAMQCSVAQFDYSAVVEEFTDFGGEALCQLNWPLGNDSVVIVGLADSEVLACRNFVLEAASAAGLECL